jgi:glyoxylase-like metal-dependent hydrolase (beta-lactamase superfamily II)
MLIFGNRMDIPYEPVADGQAVVAGGVRVRCLATPGHTPGSMCYVVDDRYLFTGDTMSLMNGRAGLFSDFFNMDSAIQRESLRRIGALPGIAYVFTGHHGITDDYGKAFEK